MSSARIPSSCTRPAREPVASTSLRYAASPSKVTGGYRLAGVELLGQLSSTDVVVCAVGSGGTMAGLVAGLGVNRVLGIHTGAVADPRATVGRLLCEMGEEVDPESLRIRMDQVGDGYESLTGSAHSALITAVQAGGIILDPVYTARAFAGLTSEVAEGNLRPGTSVVLLASGGLPGLFGHEGVQSWDWTQ
ncbi:pyridoxal-phosphate dependent enzyme [Rhodococcoides fascians]|uniref:pyridoxal-phosphate dependent enzyme n=1 Tax=Rhodococcoides fascians TaxID=1828 RepID=UPI001E606AFF|nr:pyridoxal-phosphate dependent enzyme [Rhodococcus fascians]